MKIIVAFSHSSLRVTSLLIYTCLIILITMVPLQLKRTLLVLAFGLVVSVHVGSAFSTTSSTRTGAQRSAAFGVLRTSNNIRHETTAAALFMASDDDETVTTKVPSGRKELAYDDETGRFFETDESECVPEDEYCLLDKDSGKYIRLTMEEKERIFLDSLQVRMCCFQSGL